MGNCCRECKGEQCSPVGFALLHSLQATIGRPYRAWRLRPQGRILYPPENFMPAALLQWRPVFHPCRRGRNTRQSARRQRAPFTRSRGEVFQDVVQVGRKVDGAHAVQDLLVALLRLHALLGVAAAPWPKPKSFSKVYSRFSSLAPAEALEGEGQGHGVAIVDVGKGVGVERVLDMAADHAGEAVAVRAWHPRRYRSR